MVAPRKYPVELRERATRLAIEARKDPAPGTGAYQRIGDQLGVHPETDEGTPSWGDSEHAARDRGAGQGEPRAASREPDSEVRVGFPRGILPGALATPSTLTARSNQEATWSRMSGTLTERCHAAHPRRKN